MQKILKFFQIDSTNIWKGKCIMSSGVYPRNERLVYQEKPATHIVPNGERQNDFPLRAPFASNMVQRF
jgi:hypothetical protein